MSEPGDEYLRILTGAGCDPGVISHCQTVRDVAIRIASRITDANTAEVDTRLVATGAILHDIGRSKTHGMDHADVGGILCRDLGYPPPVCRIVERHIGAGLTAEERVQLALSAQDRIPETVEEKIVAHADNLVKGVRIISRTELEEAIKKFPLPVQKRFIALADELEQLAGSALP